MDFPVVRDYDSSNYRPKGREQKEGGMALVARGRTGLALLASLLGVIALLVAACGGGDDSSDDSDGGEPTDAATAAPTDGGDDGDGLAGEAFEEVYPVNLTFWHHGFMVEITNAIHAASEPDFSGDQDFTVTVEATFTNEGDGQTFFDSIVSMITPTDTYTTSFSSDLPSVPGGGLSSDGTLLFVVDEGFEIDDAYLLIGDGNEQQAQVPLGPGGGELVALEPAEEPLTGGITMSLIDMNFTTMDLRADDLVRHSEAEPGQLLLTLNFDVTSRKSGNWSIFATEFALTLPSGSSVPVDGSDLPGLPGSDAGLETTGLYLGFVVDDPAEGTYTLRWTPPDRWLGEGDPAEATYEFVL
jgi:hypothetical protein